MRDLASISSSSWGDWTSPIFLPQTTRPQDGATQLSITKAQWVVLLRSAPQEQRDSLWASWGPRTTSYCWGWQHPASDVPQEKVTCRRHKTTHRNVGSIMVCWALGRIYSQYRYGLQCAIWVTLLQTSDGIFHFLLVTLLNFSYLNMNIGNPNLQARERKSLLLWQKGFLGFHHAKL